MDHEIIRTEILYRGRAFDTQRVLTRMPDGREKHFDLVSHKRAVTLVPVDHDGNMYFVSQFRIGAGQMLDELPAGVVETGEDPAECAARELREETGMAARSLLPLGQLYLAPGYSTEFMYLYLATDLYPAPLRQDEDEFLSLKKYTVTEAFQMAEAGKIQDAKTLAALFLARCHLQNT